MVGAMRAEHTRYEVPGWGVGEVWSTPGGLVLAHELEFEATVEGGSGDARIATRDHAREPLVPRPPKGAGSPPTATLPGIGSRVGNGSATSVRRFDALDGGRGMDGGSGFDGAARLVELASAFLAGDDVSFADVEIDLAWTTPFQLAVAETIRGIPRGELAAYGEIAALAGYPRAGRAVGRFCAGNRFMLVLPCHRVVGANGIGGYGSAGVGVKRRLLALEGVRL
jgi:methylated-DNA-[protein]-cysteine S-methyltransferase